MNWPDMIYKVFHDLLEFIEFVITLTLACSPILVIALVAYPAMK